MKITLEIKIRVDFGSIYHYIPSYRIIVKVVTTITAFWIEKIINEFDDWFNSRQSCRQSITWNRFIDTIISLQLFSWNQIIISLRLKNTIFTEIQYDITC